MSKANEQQPDMRAVQFSHDEPESPGRYWITPTAEGREVQFSPPTTAGRGAAEDDPASEAQTPARSARKLSEPRSMDEAHPDTDNQAEEPEKSEDVMRCSTDNVDREIEQLRSRVSDLEQAARSADAEDREKAQHELDVAKRELAQKDNDSYRRQHAVFTQIS